MVDEKMLLYTDGASSGNPGPTAAAWMVVRGGKVLLEDGEYLGKATNNVAEYSAIIRGMEACIANGFDDVLVLSDSQLCIRQINGEYRVRKARLKPLYDEVTRLSEAFGAVEFVWVPRDDEWIARCDRMAKGLIEEHLKGRV